jgi:hypothetical protein
MKDYVFIRDEAVEKMRAAFPASAKIHIAAHPGNFTEQTIKQAAMKTPAILTSLVKTADGEANSISFVSWVLYRASAADKLYDGALRIVSALIPVIREMDFDLAIKNTNIEAECLYSGSLDAINITLWAVKWELKLVDYFANGEGKTLAEALAVLESFDGYDGTMEIGSAAIGDNVNLEEEN